MEFKIAVNCDNLTILNSLEE